MTENSVLVERTGAVATITMNRAERRNALTAEMKVELLGAVSTVAKDPQVRAVVLTGAGPAFSVGQDLAEHATALEQGATAAFETVREHYSPLVLELMTMPKPVVAAVSGACVGAGLGLALACDVRVFGSDTKMATAFSAIGLTFDSGLSFTLPRVIGDARARRLMLLGSSFGVSDAVSWGIDGEVVEPAEVIPTAQRLARQLAEGPTFAFGHTKQLLHASQGLSLADALEAEAWAQTRCGATADHSLAVSAFLARHQPLFTGA